MKNLLLYLVFSILLLAACSNDSSTLQAAVSTATPPIQPTEGSHPPVILRVVERVETQGEATLVHKDITFTDPDGDAVAVVNSIVSSSLSVTVLDDPIQSSVQEQKVGALVTATYGCGVKLDLVIAARIADRAGNLSEPVTLTISCTTTPVDVSAYLTRGIVPVFVIGLFLLVGFWLLFQRQPAERLAALRATLLLFCLLFSLVFLFIFFHEGGHALVNWFNRGKVEMFYVHPFSFSGYSLPAYDWGSVWFHLGGALLVLPASLLIALLFRKQRSFIGFPLVLFFSWAAILQGMNIMLASGDFRNVIEITGLPTILFNLIGAFVFGAGSFSLWVSLPRLGLSPLDRKALLVLPTGIFLWSIVGLAVAYILVPGSPIDTRYDLLREILQGANSSPLTGTGIGLLLAVLYLTLFRWLYPKLPASWRNETVSVSWCDLRFPALWAVISVGLGIIIIT
jgi:hypothetical protein